MTSPGGPAERAIVLYGEAGTVAKRLPMTPAGIAIAAFVPVSVPLSGSAQVPEAEAEASGGLFGLLVACAPVLFPIMRSIRNGAT